VTLSRTARLTTDTLAPANLVIAILLIIGWHSTSSFTGLGWGVLAALFCGGIPFAVIMLGVKRGSWTDKHSLSGGVIADLVRAFAAQVRDQLGEIGARRTGGQAGRRCDAVGRWLVDGTCEGSGRRIGRRRRVLLATLLAGPRAGSNPTAPTGGHVADVRIETVAVDATGSRQISSRTRTSSALGDRAAELEEAIVQASVIAQQSLSRVQRRDGWQVASMEVAFGLTLAAEAGVILSKASAEASFEVTLTVERVPESP
jgi:hypothetical protein